MPVVDHARQTKEDAIAAQDKTCSIDMMDGINQMVTARGMIIVLYAPRHREGGSEGETTTEVEHGAQYVTTAEGAVPDLPTIDTVIIER